MCRVTMRLRELLVLHICLTILWIHSADGAAIDNGDAEVNTFNLYLISVFNSKPSGSSGSSTATVTVTKKNELPSTLEKTQNYTFPNHIISSACGTHVSRCRELTIISEVAGPNIFFLFPLNSAIGVMKFEEAGGELIRIDTHIMEYAHQDCITLTIVEFNDKPYSVCIDSTSRIISCSVNMNFANLTQSYLQCASLGDRSLPIQHFDYSLISNFVHTGSEFFVFAVGDILYKLYPERNVLGAIPHCRLPASVANTRLVFNDHTTLLVYYSTGENSTVVPFDTLSECWPSFYFNQELEYSCFDGFNVFVYPYASAILFEKQEPEDGDEPTQIPIHGTDFTIGRCFGNSTHTSFIYVDELLGTFVLDVTSQESTELSNSMCMSGSCQAPLLYQDQYLILRERDRAKVLNIRSNYISVVETSTGTDRANLIGFFTGSVYETFPGTEKPGADGNNKKDGKLGSIVGGVICLFLLFFATGVFILLFWRYGPLSKTRQENANQQRRLNSPGKYRMVNRDLNDGGSEGTPERDQEADTGTVTSNNGDTSRTPGSFSSSQIESSTSSSEEDLPVRTNIDSTAREDTSSAPSDPPTLANSQEDAANSSHSTSHSHSSFSELYPDRGPLPAEAQHTHQNTPAICSVASSTTSLSPSDMSREHYTAVGASDSEQDLSMTSPVQASEEQATQSLKHDCSSVLTTGPHGPNMVTPSQDRQLGLSMNQTDRPTSLPSVTGSSSTSDTRELSSPSVYTPGQVEFNNPIPVSPSVQSLNVPVSQSIS